MIRYPVFALACLAPAFASSADRLDVKTGLWETESTVQMSGLPIPKSLRDTLKPEQLAKMRAELDAEAAEGPTRDISRECITEEDLSDPFKSFNRQECRQTTVTTTGKTQEARMVCEGEFKGTGVIRINSPTPETMNVMITSSTPTTRSSNASVRNHRHRWHHPSSFRGYLR